MPKDIPSRRRVLKSKTGKERKGITRTASKSRYSLTAHEDIGAIKDFFEQIPSTEEKVFKYIDYLEKFAIERLAKSGIDYNDRTSRDFKYQKANGSMTNYYGILKDKELEPEWYAGKILTEALLLRRFIKEGKFFDALNSAILLEGARGDYNFANFELEVMIGLEGRERGRKSAKFNQPDREGWLKQAKVLFETKSKDYHKANGERNYKAVALQITADNNLESRNTQTIYKYLLGNREKI